MEGGTKSSTSRNPKPNRHKLQALAFHFLRSLSLVHRTAPNASPAARTRRIHRAAYASMAYAVGPSRAWSRALLRKLRRWPPAGMGREGARRHRRRRSAALRTSCSGIAWTKSSGTESSSSSSSSMMNGAASGEYRLCEAAAAEGTLRRVVPGGEGMDCCDLLEETADYIECLSAQVRIMQTIVDSCHLS